VEKLMLQSEAQKGTMEYNMTLTNTIEDNHLPSKVSEREIML
jgi:hypothetical protein